MNLFRILSFAFFAIFTIVQASNWSPEDYEIFNLNDKIQQDLGKGTTFYSWLGLEDGPKSKLEEISKAYRKKSRQLHPDKQSKSSKAAKKKAEEMFQRLSLVANILRDQSLKKRYDYFLTKGFPKWRKTGYYYSKFRPGFIMTLVILFFFANVLHYIGLSINRKQDFKRIVDLKREIKLLAWGNLLSPPLDGSERKVSGISDRQFMVHANGDVSLIKDNELVPVDENEINTKPFFKETLLYRVTAALWNITLGKITGKEMDTSVLFENPTKKTSKESRKEIKKTKKKIDKDHKVLLPNGKVAYGRSNKGKKKLN
ncbi:uncharacterized protein PRCAT00005696001 [Priceomyces carsonii]|uniref:uncharacterized protein n=1 Tax=Priceomyces carsonii TaxID=28549 RepID=UPI002ED9AEF7|nr:unnamed protein product [Priceomyces carsonii]